MKFLTLMSFSKSYESLVLPLLVSTLKFPLTTSPGKKLVSDNLLLFVELVRLLSSVILCFRLKRAQGFLLHYNQPISTGYHQSVCIPTLHFNIYLCLPSLCCNANVCACARTSISKCSVSGVYALQPHNWSVNMPIHIYNLRPVGS